jgi:fumarate hydratase subunit beta
MIATRQLTLPIDEATIRSLNAGDFVELTGEIVLTAGLPTHQRILDYVRDNKPLPIDISGGTLFHLGSYSQDTPAGFEVLYINPTTSTRFNAVMPPIVRHFGLRMIGGKGGLDHACVEALKEVGCVYLSFLGGGSPLLSDAIKEVKAVAWEDFVSHYRLVKLRVENLGPLVVGIDAKGNSTFETLSAQARERMPDILHDLDAERAKSSLHPDP